MSVAALDELPCPPVDPKALWFQQFYVDVFGADAGREAFGSDFFHDKSPHFYLKQLRKNPDGKYTDDDGNVYDTKEECRAAIEAKALAKRMSKTAKRRFNVDRSALTYPATPYVAPYDAPRPAKRARMDLLGTILDYDSSDDEPELPNVAEDPAEKSARPIEHPSLVDYESSEDELRMVTDEEEEESEEEEKEDEEEEEEDPNDPDNEGGDQHDRVEKLVEKLERIDAFFDEVVNDGVTELYDLVDEASSVHYSRVDPPYAGECDIGGEKGPIVATATFGGITLELGERYANAVISAVQVERYRRCFSMNRSKPAVLDEALRVIDAYHVVKSGPF